MARHFELSTDEQVWVMLRVKQGLMSMEDALEYVRCQHEEASYVHDQNNVGQKVTSSVRVKRSNTEVGKHNFINNNTPQMNVLNRLGTAPRSHPQQQPNARVGRAFSLFKFNRQKSIAVDEASNQTWLPVKNGRPRSVFASLSAEAGKTGHGELLDLMVAQGKITSDDRQELLKKYGTAENYRAGDTQRMILANLVKTSKISIEDAVHYSRLVGIVGSAETEARTIAEVNNAFQEKRVYNFGVYKYYRHRTSQRRILQIDFQSCQICNIQKGNLNRKFPFTEIADYESEEGLRIFIYFKEHHEYELEADTLEEKEKICRLLQLIVEQSKLHGRARPQVRRELRSSLSQCQKVIREGFLEKKNHSLYTTWARRWVRIRQGELSYYKPDDENQQALNILQLSREVNIIKKMGTNGFSIATRKKVYQFRVITGGIGITEIESQRDEWFKAIRHACGERRESQAVSNYGDDSLSVSTEVPLSPVRSAYSENVQQSLKSFYKEIESLHAMLGINEMRDDAVKTLLRLRQIIKGLEGFVMEKQADDSRKSGQSIMSNMDTSISDISSSTDPTSPNKSLDSSALTLTLVNNLNKDCNTDQVSKLTTEHLSKRIVGDVNSMLSALGKNNAQDSNLETVIEHKNEGSMTSSTDETEVKKGNEDCGKNADLDDEMPEGPPPPPPDAVFVPPPPPPPPPPFLAPAPAKNCKVKSKVKMKAFHWNKIPNRMFNQSIWKDARDLTEKIDTEMLELMYADNVKETFEPEVTKNKLKSILDPKVAQNLGIFLAGFKMDVEELKYRLTILQESEGGLNQEHVNVLRRYHPSAEDTETYKQFKDCPHELETTDQFMMQLCEIPHLRTRLDILFITNEFPVQFEDLAPTIKNVLFGCRVLCDSDKFLAILEYVLAVGNFINSGSSKGTAVGFRLSSLPKLSDCKAKDKKLNLLKYLVQQIHKHEPELLGFIDELLPLTRVPEASVKALQAEVEVMKKDLTKVKQNALQLINMENPPERDVAFCEDVESFIEQFETKLSLLQEETDEIKTLYDNILVRFGEPSSTESSEIFLCISEFVNAFKREVDLIMVTARGFQRRKSKKVVSRQLSCKSSARDSAVESYTSLDQSDSMGSDTEAAGDGSEQADISPRMKMFSERFSEHRSLRAGSRRLGGDARNMSKRLAQSRKLPENPTKEGILEKLSNTKSPLSSQWNRRFFELTTKGYLHYCKRKHDKNVESIYLRGCPIALEDDRTIIIQTEERAYKLRAATHEEAQDWLECMLVYTLKPINISSHSRMPGRLMENIVR